MSIHYYHLIILTFFFFACNSAKVQERRRTNYEKSEQSAGEASDPSSQSKDASQEPDRSKAIDDNPNSSEEKISGEQSNQYQPEQIQESESNTNQENSVENNVVVNDTSDPVDFSIAMLQTAAGCPSECGIYFDPLGDNSKNPKLEITYSLNGQQQSISFQQGQGGNKEAYAMDSRFNRQGIILVKNPSATGYFYADISDVPATANITSATLYLTLHKHEGISNNDKVSVIAVYEYSKAWNYNTGYGGGSRGDLIREIRAKEDMWDKGIQKYLNPTGGYDFTSYVQQLQSNR